MDIQSLFEQHELAFYGARALMLAVALLIFGLAFGSWRRNGSREMQRLFTELDRSRNETRVLSDLAQRMASQLEVLQSRVDDRQQLAAASAGGGQRGYDLALQMARHGATPDQMVSASGVTRNEASLLARLHNPPRQ